MKITFSRHVVEDKIPQLKEMGFRVSLNSIKEIIKNPDHTDGLSDEPKYIASKAIQDNYILRVVYKVDSGIIKVITIYPTTRGRYY